MLVIRNYKKIKNQYFGDWQVGKVEELPECYAMQVWNTTEKKSVTMVIIRNGQLSDEWNELIYPISLVEDNANNNVITDTIYKSVLEDMELFGESLIHYLNTL